MGVNTTRAKVISCHLLGVGRRGRWPLRVLQVMFLHTTSFTFVKSIRSYHDRHRWMGSNLGAVVGGGHLHRSDRGATRSRTQYASGLHMVVFSLLLVVIMIFRPRGSWGASRPVTSSGASAPTRSPPSPTDMPLLEIKNVTMQFGGLVAVNQVTWRSSPVRSTALIGPNGAGKTTLFNVLTGVYVPTSGGVLFSRRRAVAGRRLPPYRIARRGDRAHVPEHPAVRRPDSVLDNVMVAIDRTQRAGSSPPLLRGPMRLRAEEKERRDAEARALLAVRGARPPADEPRDATCLRRRSAASRSRARWPSKPTSSCASTSRRRA